MYITDLYGKRIEITNPKDSVEQLKVLIKYFESETACITFNKAEKDYWKDILDKLEKRINIY